MCVSCHQPKPAFTEHRDHVSQLAFSQGFQFSIFQTPSAPSLISALNLFHTDSYIVNLLPSSLPWKYHKQLHNENHHEYSRYSRRHCVHCLVISSCLVAEPMCLDDDCFSLWKAAIFASPLKSRSTQTSTSVNVVSQLDLKVCNVGMLISIYLHIHRHRYKCMFIDAFARVELWRNNSWNHWKSSNIYFYKTNTKQILKLKLNIPKMAKFT